MQTATRFTLENGRVALASFSIGNHNGVRFEIWDIDPPLAERLLEKVHNRPQKVVRVKKYAREMKHGAWRLNYEWIGIDEHGYVIEGQHRLLACIEADTPFQTLVIIGLDRALFPYLGAALPRGAADNIALSGVANANQVAGALAYVWRAERGVSLYATGAGARAENHEILDLLARHPKVLDSVSAGRRCQRIFPSTSLMTYLHYEFSRRDQALADAFIDKLSDGTGLKYTDPVYLLRERLIDDKAGKTRMTQKYLIALTIKAWNYMRAGRRAPKFLRWNENANEEYPAIA